MSKFICTTKSVKPDISGPPNQTTSKNED